MPKQKTNRTAAKRFKKCGNGKFRRATAYRRHLLSDKSRKVKRHLRQYAYVHPTNEAAVKSLLPNG
jgi:large subunit ribosomal protein L35